MSISKKFAVIINNIEYGDRVNISNISLNDVITYKVQGYWIFSIVIGTTNTMIKVVDLFCENTNCGINLYISKKRNHTTKCLLNPKRKIFKIKNVIKL